MSRRKWSAEYQIVDKGTGEVWAIYGPGSKSMLHEDLRLARNAGLRVAKRRVPESEKGLPEGCKIGFVFECLLPEYREHAEEPS